MVVEDEGSSGAATVILFPTDNSVIVLLRRACSIGSLGGNSSSTGLIDTRDLTSLLLTVSLAAANISKSSKSSSW